MVAYAVDAKLAYAVQSQKRNSKDAQLRIVQLRIDYGAITETTSRFGMASSFTCVHTREKNESMTQITVMVEILCEADLKLLSIIVFKVLRYLNAR